MGSLDPEALLGQFSWQLVITLVIAALAGALGALVPGRAPMRNPAPAPAPAPDAKDLRDTRELGGWQRAFVGAVAAAAVLAVIDVTTLLQLICGSLVAGYAGTAVLAGLESRLVAILAVQETAAMRREVNELNADARELGKQVDKLMPMTASPATTGPIEAITAIRKRRDWS